MEKLLVESSATYTLINERKSFCCDDSFNIKSYINENKIACSTLLKEEYNEDDCTPYHDSSLFLSIGLLQFYLVNAGTKIKNNIISYSTFIQTLGSTFVDTLKNIDMTVSPIPYKFSKLRKDVRNNYAITAYSPGLMRNYILKNSKNSQIDVHETHSSLYQKVMTLVKKPNKDSSSLMVLKKKYSEDWLTSEDKETMKQLLLNDMSENTAIYLDSREKQNTITAAAQLHHLSDYIKNKCVHDENYVNNIKQFRSLIKSEGLSDNLSELNFTNLKYMLTELESEREEAILASAASAEDTDKQPEQIVNKKKLSLDELLKDDIAERETVKAVRTTNKALPDFIETGYNNIFENIDTIGIINSILDHKKESSRICKLQAVSDQRIAPINESHNSIKVKNKLFAHKEVAQNYIDTSQSAHDRLVKVFEGNDRMKNLMEKYKLFEAHRNYQVSRKAQMFYFKRKKAYEKNVEREAAFNRVIVQVFNTYEKYEEIRSKCNLSRMDISVELLISTGCPSIAELDRYITLIKDFC